MKKISIPITISMLTLSFFFISTPSAMAWDDCPFGKENDPYPGDCSRYIDTDNDGICDHSQPAPEDRIANEIADTNASTDENGSENANPTDTTASPSMDAQPSEFTNDLPQEENIATTQTTQPRSVDALDENDSQENKIITGIVAIVAPLSLILGYALWQKIKS